MKEQNGVSKWYIGAAVLLAVVGVVMLVWPHLTMELLGIMIGICMLVIGLVYIILYFTKDHQDTIMQMDLTVGVVLAAFGAFMLMHNDFVNIALPFAAGIILLIGGISKIQYAIQMKRLSFSKWFLLLIMSIILIVFGLVMLYNPFKQEVLIYAIGVSLIVDGVLSIVAVLLVSHRLKQMARGVVYTGSDRQIVDHQGKWGKKKGGRGTDEIRMPADAVPPMETVEDPQPASDTGASFGQAGQSVESTFTQNNGFGENSVEPSEAPVVDGEAWKDSEDSNVVKVEDGMDNPFDAPKNKRKKH